MPFEIGRLGADEVRRNDHDGIGTGAAGMLAQFDDLRLRGQQAADYHGRLA
ncbi:hypothetical protein D3C83_195170 [compost metagenome]